jgi:MYXO-CTERM domain-containing protein
LNPISRHPGRLGDLGATLTVAPVSLHFNNLHQLLQGPPPSRQVWTPEQYRTGQPEIQTMNAARLAVALPAILALTGSAASAAIVGVTGNTTWLGTPPPGCAPGQLSGMNAFAWDEQQNVALSLNVDMTNNPGSSTSPIPGTVSGTYDSHFIHFEGIPGVIGAQGTVTYNNPIVAVIFRNTTLDNSDAPAGAPSTAYPTLYPFRGLSSAPASFFSINGNTLTFNLNTVAPTQFVDQIRVLTQAPAPGSLALLGLGGLVAARRRR